MAHSGKMLHNMKTGQTLEFVTTAEDSGGALLEMISTYAPHSTHPPAHYHPFQYEHFTVLEGELTVRLNGKTIILKPGYSIGVPKDAVHSMWNASDQPTVVRWKVTPALETEYFLEALMNLSNEGRTDDTGKPALKDTAQLMQRYSQEFRLAKPPYVIQKAFFSVVSGSCNRGNCKSLNCIKRTSANT